MAWKQHSPCQYRTSRFECVGPYAAKSNASYCIPGTDCTEFVGACGTDCAELDAATCWTEHSATPASCKVAINVSVGAINGTDSTIDVGTVSINMSGAARKGGGVVSKNSATVSINGSTPVLRGSSSRQRS
eukprot:3865286-Rhodomonas_salina.1